MVGASETPYDLRFRLLGVPVRIHPMFWLVSAVLGWQDHRLGLVVLWVGCALVSILVHEYGHALMAKRFDCSPSIVLWGLGGLCYSQGERQSPMQRLAVILSGPGAGFVLFGVVLLITSLLFKISPGEHWDSVLSLVGLAHFPATVAEKFVDGAHSVSTGSFLTYAYHFLIWINLMWGLINLLPLWPLDGGQATQILLSMIDRFRGPRWGHIVSLLTAGAIAVMVGTWTKDMFLTIFFIYFAVINFQVLQTLHQAHSMGLYQEDEWWRR
jgi:membrane-associated protease RseP (regulator of RpoE activity)